MPRRNNREVLDLTPSQLVEESRNPFRGPSPENREEARRKARERARRQLDARINGGIDWSACLVPHCEAFVSIRHRRDHTDSLPLCYDHLVVAASHAAHFTNDPLMQAAADRYLARQRASEDAAKAAYLARTDGHMYFVRLNDLVKVGWTRSLKPRLKAYGASAEVLVHYPATRDDETLLHRQLRPALAKGREWYHDGPIVQQFLNQALAEHGPPTITVAWTEPRPVVASKRHK